MARSRLSLCAFNAMAWLTAGAIVCLAAPGCSQGPSRPAEPSGSAGAAGTACDAKVLSEGCHGAARMVCDGQTWKASAPCAPGRTCFESVASSIVTLPAGEQVGCCKVPPIGTCQQLCAAAPKVADGLRQLLGGETIQAMYGCDASTATCVCRLFETGGPGICSTACDGSPCTGELCNGAVKFGLSDRKFQDVQVVSAFPAVLEGGVVRRVCGAPLSGGKAAVADRVELTVNLVSMKPSAPLCANDGDRSIKEGERVELLPVKTSQPDATALPEHFEVQLDCVQPREPSGGGGKCATAVGNMTIKATHVRYENLAARCGAAGAGARVDLALVIDRSGSTAGWVDAIDAREDRAGGVSLPVMLEPSDYQNARDTAGNALLSALNVDHDRVIGYYFDEKVGADVAASDQRYCDGGDQENKRCLFEDDCTGGFNCEPGSGTDWKAPVSDTFLGGTLADNEKRAFGAGAAHRRYLETALADKATQGGEGRAPLWHAVKTAHDFLKNTAPLTSKARHILVLTDGPDTCSPGESFAYENASGKCRTPCTTGNLEFTSLLKALQADGFPVRVHFIQFQAKAQAYRRPDAGMMEVACRSGGTYQFINSQEINSKDASFSNAMLRAVMKVRYALSGSWKVAIPLNQFGPGGDIKTGTVYAMQGHLKYRNPRFVGLDSVYKDSPSWRFGFEHGLDGRLMLRSSCVTHSDCGGTTECAANHCSADGVCMPGEAPDRLPCGDGKGVCCGGSCDTSGGGCKMGCK